MIKHGSWPNVTDKESIAIKTLLANIFNGYTVFFFEESLLHSFMTSAENLGHSKSCVFTKADSEYLKQV